MATVKCALGHRGYPSHEWNDCVKDRIYCLGRIDQMTDELLPECKACPDHVNKAQGDLEAFYGRDRNGGYMCGKYKQEHEGACRGCRWKKPV